MLLLAYLSLFFNLGTPIVNLLGSLYLGYTNSVLGGIIGLSWGILDGFIGGALTALIYNCSLCCCPCWMCKKSKCDTPKCDN